MSNIIETQTWTGRFNRNEVHRRTQHF